MQLRECRTDSNIHNDIKRRSLRLACNFCKPYSAENAHTQCMKLVTHSSKKSERDFVEIAWGAEYTEQMTQSITWLQDEIADRMLQKLDIVKLDVKAVLLIPEFPGKYFSLLKKRFPGARVDGLYEDDASRVASIQTKLFQLWQRVFKGAHRSPLKDYLQTGKLAIPNNSVDLIFCE